MLRHHGSTFNKQGNKQMTNYTKTELDFLDNVDAVIDFEVAKEMWWQTKFNYSWEVKAEDATNAIFNQLALEARK